MTRGFRIGDELSIHLDLTVCFDPQVDRSSQSSRSIRSVCPNSIPNQSVVPIESVNLQLINLIPGESPSSVISYSIVHHQILTGIPIPVENPIPYQPGPGN